MMIKPMMNNGSICEIVDYREMVDNMCFITKIKSMNMKGALYDE